MLRTALKDVSQRKLRLLATGIAVILGVAFVAGTFVLTDTVGRSFDDLFASVNRGTDAVVRSAHKQNGQFGNGTQRPQIPESLVSKVAAVPGVAHAVGGTEGYAQLIDKSGDAIGNPNQGPPTQGTTWTTVKSLNPFHVVDGHPPRGDHQVVLDKGSADKGHFHVGDKISLLTLKGRIHVVVAGIAKFGTADSPGGASISLFAPAAAQKLLGAPGQVDNIRVAAKPGVSQPQLVKRIDKVLPEGVQAVTGKKITKQDQDAIRQGLGFFTTFLLVFAVVSLVVGAFIIVNTFSIIVAQRTRELALFRAMGASRRQVLASVLVEAFAVGLVSAVIGLGLGILTALGLKAALSAFGVDLPATGLLVKPRTIIVAIVVGVVVTLLSAILPARRAARVPPVAAMRDVAVDDSGQSRIRPITGLVLLGLAGALFASGIAGHDVKVVGIAAGVLLVGLIFLGPVIARYLGSWLGSPVAALRGITGRLARQNTARSPRRTASTASALGIGVALVAFITVFASSAKASVNHLVDNQFRADYVVASAAGKVPEALVAKIDQSPQVGAVAAFRTAPVKVLGQSNVSDSDLAQLSQVMDLNVTEGDLAKVGRDGIAISARKAKDKHLRLGSPVTVKFLDGSRRTFKVEALYKADSMAGPVLLNEKGLASVARENSAQLLVVKRADGVEPAQLRHTLDRLTAPYPTAKVQDTAQFKNSQAKQVNGLLAFIYVLLALAVIIALIGIANTMGLSILERTRELGLLRAVGMSRSQTRSTVRLESVLIAAAGTVLGIALGVGLGVAVIKAIPSHNGLTEVAIPLSLVLIFVLGLIVGVIAAVWPARRAAKLDVLRAIATE